MVYANVTTDKNRILNHLELIEKKRNALDSPGANKGLLCQAGHIELQLTDRCCLNCPNCHFRGLGDKEIPFEEWTDEDSTGVLDELDKAFGPSGD